MTKTDESTRARVPAWAAPVALVLTKVALSCIVLWAGFTHVSDDDYSRTVIAEQFAHAPRLDPSGTSWLPFPFWVHGTSMLLFGRTLATARTTAFVLGVLATVIFWLGLRTREKRDAFLISVAAFALPWMAWLSVATVPEAVCAGLASAGALGLSRAEKLQRVDVAFALCVLLATLCRYEAWAMAVVSLLLVSLRARRHRQARLGVLVALLCAVGPVAWVVWNGATHGDAFHFLARVARFRKSTGQAEGSTTEKLLFYPRAVWQDEKEILVLALVAIAGIARHRSVRVMYGGALLSCGAVLAFLLVGALRDGAPTHHPARALCITYPILIAVALASIRATMARYSTRVMRSGVAAAAALLVGTPWFFAEAPGRSAAEDRTGEIERGQELRLRGAHHVDVAPCAYEHFALIAAYGAPENVTVLPPQKPAATVACSPAVDVVW